MIHTVKVFGAVNKAKVDVFIKDIKSFFSICFLGASLVAQMVKNLPAVWETAMQETEVLIPGSRRFPGEENGYPLQCSCLENPMDRGTWQAKVYGITKSWT